MILKGIIFEDFVNYKKPCMTLEFPRCSFKCDMEAGASVCQNSALASAPDEKYNVRQIVEAYINNDIAEAICFQGLEPFDDFRDVLYIIRVLRWNYRCEDDVVIYTGYTEQEVSSYIELLLGFDNIIVKFGRFIPNRPHVYDEVLGVELSSDNQYAKRISYRGDIANEN